MSTSRKQELPKILAERSGREWIVVFLLSGVLLGPIGSLLVVWQYHINADGSIIGIHFLGLYGGYLIASSTAESLMRRWMSPAAVTRFGCFVGFGSLVALSFLAPPVALGFRILALAGVGISAGAVTSSALRALRAYYAEARAITANLAGLLFGLGSCAATLVVGSTYFTGSVRIQTELLCVVPLLFLLLYLRRERRSQAIQDPLPDMPDPEPHHDRDLRSAAAVLFSLILFFQFGNECAIAGWLPLFLIHRLGSNPESAIFTLALYFFALILGRLVAQGLLPRVNHRQLLLGSITAAMIGYLLLSFTNSIAGACAAIVVIGAGFAPIYPLVAESLDQRFASHPDFYNRIVSAAITGAISAPWLLGYVDSYFGMRYVMLIPAIGSIAVLILALMIMLEAHLMRGPVTART